MQLPFTAGQLFSCFLFEPPGLARKEINCGVFCSFPQLLRLRRHARLLLYLQVAL